MPPKEAEKKEEKKKPESSASATGENGQTLRKGGGNVTYGKHATMPVMIADLYAEVNIPELTEFDPTQMKLDGTVVAIGKRRTGKSWVFRNLMYIMKDTFPAGIVISQTDELNKFWRQYIPKKFIYNKYEPEILDAVFTRQKDILNNPNYTDEEKEEKARFFIILDDVISDPRLRYDANLMELFVAGRHYKLMIFFATQYVKAITPTIRGNTDYVFLMKTMQGGAREALYEDFCDFLTKDAFGQILDAYTEDNEVLVINTDPELKVDPTEIMYWWKACDPGEFLVGSKEYWAAAMQDNAVPPTGMAESTMKFADVKSIMPTPWRDVLE